MGVCKGRRQGEVRLKSVTDTDAGEHSVANLFSESCVLVYGGEKTETDGPEDPAEYNQFFVAASPGNHQTRESTAKGFRVCQ